MVVKALKSPPTSSTASAIAEGDRSVGALEEQVLEDVRRPGLARRPRRASRCPPRTRWHTDRASSIRSVTSESPEGSRSVRITGRLGPAATPDLAALAGTGARRPRRRRAVNAADDHPDRRHPRRPVVATRPPPARDRRTPRPARPRRRPRRRRPRTGAPFGASDLPPRPDDPRPPSLPDDRGRRRPDRIGCRPRPRPMRRRSPTSDSETFPCGSMSSTRTSTGWPSSKTSSTRSTRLPRPIFEMWSRPSRPGKDVDERTELGDVDHLALVGDADLGERRVEDGRDPPPGLFDRCPVLRADGHRADHPVVVDRDVRTGLHAGAR